MKKTYKIATKTTTKCLSICKKESVFIKINLLLLAPLYVDIYVEERHKDHLA